MHTLMGICPNYHWTNRLKTRGKPYQDWKDASNIPNAVVNNIAGDLQNEASDQKNRENEE